MMNSTRPTLPPLPDNERTPFIDALLERVQWQSERIADLEDDTQSLKKTTKKPKFKASKMDQETESAQKGEDADNDKQHKKQRVRRKKKKT